MPVCEEAAGLRSMAFDGCGQHDFRAALREWQPLLQALTQISTPSPVGAAIHWIRCHGYSGPVSTSTKRTCLASRIWRLVPHLLAVRVAVFAPHDQANVGGTNLQQQPAAEEADDGSQGRKRKRSTIAACGCRLCPAQRRPIS